MSTGERRAVIAEAVTWLGTPYHHMGRVKGGGTDCLMMLAEVYQTVGIIGPLEIPFYPPDWHLHRGVERYLAGLGRHACEISAPPQPGDAVLFKFGRCFAHGAIVVGWPRVIHAWHRAGVIADDVTQPRLAGRAMRFFDPFGRGVPE